MQSKKELAMSKEEYWYYITLDERYNEFIELSECYENKLKCGYFNTDKDLNNRINLYLELSDNYEIDDIEDLFNFEIREDIKGKYFLIDIDMLPNGAEVEIREYLEEKPKEINLEDLIKRKIIRSVKNIGTKVKLLDPKVYNNTREFNFTLFES